MTNITSYKPPYLYTRRVWRETWMIMRLTTFLIIISTLTISAKSYSQKVNLSLKDSPLETAFGQIRQQTGVSFLWTEQTLKGLPPVSVSVHGASLQTALDACLKDLPLTFNIHGKVVYIERKLVPVLKINPVVASPVPPLHEVTGKVKDSTTGSPLFGVTIRVKGTTTGTTSDANGKYSLQVQDDAVLIVSFLGYERKEIPVNGRNVVNITLTTAATGLNQLVVVGYGTQRKQNVTGAITTISGTDIVKSPSASISNSLAGISPGLVINNRSGRPGGDDALMLIRGYNTFSNGSAGVGPLIVVDGIPDRNFNRIDPNDIESISILKDASAAIYGVRAANGVILVTTKHGQSGKMSLTYDGSVSMQHLTRIAPRVNAWDYMQYYDELAVINGTQVPYDPATIANYKTGGADYTSTDWTTQVFRNWAPQTSHSLNLKGGSEAVQYYLSGQFIEQMSNYRNSNLSYKNYNFRANIDVQANKYLKLNADLAAWRQQADNPAISDGSIMHEMVSIYPYIPVYWKNGSPSGGLGYGRNPVLMSSDLPGYDNITYYTLNSKFGFDLQMPFITDGLSISGYGAFDYNNTFEKFFERPWHAYSYNASTNTYSDQYATTSISKISQNNTIENESTLFLKLGYDKKFGDHSISAFAAYEQTTDNSTNSYAYRNKLLSNELDQIFTGAADANQVGTGSAAQWGRASYFGKVDYAYKSKYLLEGILRYNGSFNFAPGKQWGLFPAVSAGWRISEENFFQSIRPVINDLKLRASWGKMGSDAVAQYLYLATYGIIGNPVYYTYFGGNYDQSTAIYPSSTPNINMTWESQDTKDIGLDMTMLHNKLTFTFDIFRNYRTGILAQPNASIPLYTGLTLPYLNIGKNLNRGLEFAVNYSERQTKLQYSIGANFTYNKSKVIYIDESPNIPAQQRYTGHTVDSWLMYQTNGIYKTVDEVNNSPHLPGAGPGDIWIKDINGDGLINANDRMRVDKGVKPRILFGLPVAVNYKGIGLSVTFAGQADAWVEIRPSAQSAVVVPTQWMFDERFISASETPNAVFPRATNSNDTRNNVDASIYLRSAAFVRLKTAELSYTLQDKFLTKHGFSSLRFYLDGSNLFSIDGLKKYGVDPENTSLTGVSYPQTRIVRLGVTLSL